MSTTRGELLDCYDPKYKLLFETSYNGTKFMFIDGTEEVRKIWFTKRDWEKFKKVVDDNMEEE